MNTELIEKFESLLLSTGREGMDKLVAAIKKSDFYTAPASTRFHGSHEGGLLEHSMNVHELCREKFTTDGIWKDTCEKLGYTKENIIITSLLHDMCKMYFYVTDYKNQKVYSDTGSKKDAKGRYDWETVPVYVIEDKFPLGHGEKSVMLIERYIKLEPVERYAIRWHMGAYSGQQDWNTLGTATEKYPLILMLHEADQEATVLLEE